MLSFRVRVVPMGWSWAVHLIQAAHLHIMSSSLERRGLPVAEQNWVADKVPTEPLRLGKVARILYIDNIAVHDNESLS